MQAVSTSRLVSGYVDAGVLVLLVPLLVCSVLLAGPAARRLGTTRALAALAIVSVAGILAVTLGVRTPQGGFGGASLHWLIDGDSWSHAFDVQSGWLLNVALFVPAGLFGALATRRPVLSLIVLAALSLVIEAVQSIGLLGAPDPADLVANSLGAAIGVGLAAVGLKVFGESVGRDDRRATSRNAILIAAVVAVALAGIGWLGLVAGADARRESLADDLRTTFAGTTAVSIAAQLDLDHYDQLLAQTATRPTYLGRVGNTDEVEGRYSVDFFGLHRCVFIRWTAAGFTLRNGSGSECTVFRDRPPTY